MARLRGKGREGWSVEEHSWVCNESPTVPGHGLRGAVVGWYLPVRMLVVDEKRMSRGGVRVVVMMRGVAVDKAYASGGFEQAARIRSRKEWFRHKMSKKQLVGTTGQRVQASGGREVLVEEQEVWEEWMRQTVEDTEWRGKAKGQWRAMDQAAMRRGWIKDMERDKVYKYDRG